MGNVSDKSGSSGKMGSLYVLISSNNIKREYKKDKIICDLNKY